MTLAARVERLRALHIAAGYEPKQLLLGAAERAELNELSQQFVMTPNLTGEPASYRGLVIVEVAATYCLMVGTVTGEFVFSPDGSADNTSDAKE